MNNKRYNKVVECDLSFGQAMDALLDGEKISRSVWCGYWELRETEFGMTIVAELKDGSKAVASPYQSDMLSFDWQVVEWWVI